MDADAFTAGQRAREYFHDLTVLPGAWAVIRLDGRGFSRFTEQHFDKPFDPRFTDAMVVTARTLLTELGARYVYTESDEISLLLDPGHNLFGRSVEKLVSVSAGLASAVFTHTVAVPAHFDSRLWLGTTVDDVIDYHSWRQSDATRCALNGWCYWTLRKAGISARHATERLERASTADKNQLLFDHGINFNDLPTWQRRGIGLWWKNHPHTGYNPIQQTMVTTTRRRVTIERDLPMKDPYRELVRSIALDAAPAVKNHTDQPCSTPPPPTGEDSPP